MAVLSARAGDNPRSVTAIRVNTSLQIDGILDEDVWKYADPATDFIQRDPEEGQPASERSEIRVLHDHEALYFGCMFYDSEPEKIVARLTRRDNEIESDRASIRIDSYHDHQTGYEFTFNAAGVKVDILQFDDANREDDSWDPVWDMQTKLLPNGWSAEVKIPFRVLRYKSGSSNPEEQVWGINFLRYISRKQEQQRWAFTPKSQSGFISRFGHLRGLRQLPDPRQFEVLPFLVSKQRFEPEKALIDRKQELLGNAGIDLKFGLASNFALDATINPDFGQVEADPAVLNLSTFETFYPEKRPFFIEGTQIIRFTTFGGEFGPGMFYSRRIGRAISLDDVNIPDGGRIETLPQHTTILGAAKLNGKTNGGFSLGVMQAFTGEEKAFVVDSTYNRSEQIVEPFAHYNVVRLKQDVLDNSNVGMIVTSVAKDSRYPAFTNGYDWNLIFGDNRYSLTGFLALSHTTNTEGERISGSAGKVEYSKIAAEHWLWSFDLDFTSKNYNINDIGFFRRPNDYGIVGVLTYKEDVPARVVRNYSIGLFLHERRNFDEVNLLRESRMSGQLLFTNYWRMTASAGADVGLYDDRETRGNGLYRRPKNFSTSTYIFSDTRHVVFFKFGQRFGWTNKGMRHTATEAGVTLRPISWIDMDLETEYQRFRNQEAWIENVDYAGLTVSIFGDRSTDQYNIILRSTITFTRDLTLQLYGQVFLAKGRYENLRQLFSSSSFVPSAWYTSQPDFNRQSLNTNLVLRWEYLPGSTFFIVWSQARSGDNGNYFTSFGNDFNDTFKIPPSNVFLLKISYWWSL
ncbi:MAG: carbohydrate binding family 9 domain-containing protein [Ignavibacteriae bacterium]|nr:carbohydrate binding family 9 domain-containing protein [Ignavibacteriota bacterium]